MKRLYCDICNKETREEDMRMLSVRDWYGKHKHRTLDICTICTEDVYYYIKDISN